MEVSSINNNGTEIEKNQNPNISKLFNAPFVGLGTIQYFNLSREEINNILEQYEKLGEPLLLSTTNNNEADDEKRDRKLLKSALETGGASRNFIRNSDGSLLNFDTLNLNQAILTGEKTINDIAQAKSIEDISKIIGSEVTYRTIENSQLTGEQISNFDKKILKKEPLFNLTIATDENTLYSRDNVTEEMINILKNNNLQIFGQKQNSNYLVQYEEIKTDTNQEVLEELNSGGLKSFYTFANNMSERKDAVYSFPIDSKEKDFFDKSLEIVRKARNLVGQEINYHLIKINFLLAPYITEVDISNSGESTRRFGFSKEVPNSVIVSTIGECQAIINEAKEKESITKQQEPEKPRNKFQKFFDNLRSKK